MSENGTFDALTLPLPLLVARRATRCPQLNPHDIGECFFEQGTPVRYAPTKVFRVVKMICRVASRLACVSPVV